MIALLLAALSFKSPLSIEVKDGCTNTSSVLVEPYTLHSDGRACVKVHGRIFSTNWDPSASYWAWGECNDGMILYGFGKDKEECIGSMHGKDGIHKTIIPSEDVSNNTCICRNRMVFRGDEWYGEDVYDSSVVYRCIKEPETTTTTTTVESAHSTTTTQGQESTLIIEVQESTEDEPVPHTDDDDYFFGWIVVLPILIFAFALPIMFWPY